MSIVSGNKYRYLPVITTDAIDTGSGKRVLPCPVCGDLYLHQSKRLKEPLTIRFWCEQCHGNTEQWDEEHYELCFTEENGNTFCYWRVLR